MCVHLGKNGVCVCVRADQVRRASDAFAERREGAIEPSAGGRLLSKTHSALEALVREQAHGGHGRIADFST